MTAVNRCRDDRPFAGCNSVPPAGTMRRLCCLFLILCCGAVSSRALAQEHENRKFFIHLLEDQKKIWQFPFQPESRRSLPVWVAVGVSAASFGLDGGPSRDLREDSRFREFNDVFASSESDVWLHTVPLFFLAGGYLTENQQITQYGWKSAEAVIDTVVVTRLIKLGTQRSRPHTGQEYGFWEGGNSFPSGHAAVAWSMAALAAKEFPQHRWVPWVAYPLAGLVSFSRITSGNHFASDAVVGSVIGFGIGRYVVH